MDAVIARYLPEFADAPPRAAAPAGAEFAADWFRRAPRPDAVRPVRERAAPSQEAPARTAAAELAFAPPAPVVSDIAPFAPRPNPVRPAEDREALIAAAEERGRARGRAEAFAEAQETAAQERERERDAFEDRLAQARRDWTETQAEVLAAGFNASMRALDGQLSDRIARLLAPVLTQALRARALDELSAALHRLLAEPQHAAVRVCGPEDLIEALARRLGDLSAGIAFATAETPEVTVTADQTVIETQLAAWGRLLAAAVAEA